LTRALAIAVAVGAVVGTPAIAAADRGLGNPWGFVPGLRIGALRGSFDGTAAMPASQGGWGYTTEFHCDLLRTFDRDRRAIGLSLGYLSQTRTSDDVTVADPSTFEHSGLSATAILSTVLRGRNSLSARVGVVGGETTTAAGRIDGSLTRFGIELTHVSTYADIIDVASHVSVEYFTSGGGDRTFTAVALVVGATFAFGIF
jgi:hypothetical protein